MSYRISEEYTLYNSFDPLLLLACPWFQLPLKLLNSSSMITAMLDCRVGPIQIVYTICGKIGRIGSELFDGSGIKPSAAAILPEHKGLSG